MESESIQPWIKERECVCNCCDLAVNRSVNRSCTKTWFRSVKRKLDELEIETRNVLIPGLSTPEVARVEIENECGVLREMVTNQQQSIHYLAVELEEERDASSSAANEAMSMILRLQREKAGIEMEARQFKRFSEQKSSHDQQELAALEELLYKREQTIESLTCEVEAYKYRMMSYGLTESESEFEPEGVKSGITHSTHSNSIGPNSETEFTPIDEYDEYPPLKCHSNEQQQQTYPESVTETIDIEKHTYTETTCSIKDIEQRINQLEQQSPRHQPILDKVIVGHSPRKQNPSARFSFDSAGSFFATIKVDDSNFKKAENFSEFGSETSDIIYTVDSVHYDNPVSYHNDPKADTDSCDYASTRKDSVCSHTEFQDPEVMKLYARLQALEADRESMRRAIISMRTDKAQLVLLKEIAQNLCKDVSQTTRMPGKKQSYIGSFGRSVASLVLWRRNASQAKYMFGMTASNPGLMVVLNKASEIENECGVLREMVTNQQQSIHYLAVELEEERDASSSAANEAMSMILRLQREKAGIEMEARQFKRFSEQKSSHDQQELAALEELLYKREQTIQSLTCEVEAYKYRMMSYGLTESESEFEPEGVKSGITHSTHSNSIGPNSETEFTPIDEYDEYPPLKCHSNEQQQQTYPESVTETIDIEKHTYTETTCSIKDIEQRINQLEQQSPRHQPILDKVIVGHSPRKQNPSARFSFDSAGSFFATIKVDESNFKKPENYSEFGSETSDRIYTVDSVHYDNPVSYHNDPKADTDSCDYASTRKDSVCSHTEFQDPEVMKLYARLQALEADRESMRRAIISMRTDKAQLVLLKEIAQNLCKDVSQTTRMPGKKQSYIGSFGRSVASLVLWRRNASQAKYMFGMTASNPGLMVVLNKASEVGQWRCVSRTQL
ncbi:hypothetical protein SSX86_009167 [Deinandra increscens subsp. villosa]|uniref:GTD-binding domain-containing protein n=1 Tax=Deinandra increscens subsp. villosa TaxID=3103831 RepID=A0AAP0H5R8_9ASTR